MRAPGGVLALALLGACGGGGGIGRDAFVLADAGADASVPRDASRALDASTRDADTGPAGGDALTIAPTAWSFGSVGVGTPSPPATFTVTNTGADPSGILDVTLGGLDATSFGIAEDLCSGRALPAAGGTCTIAVVYAPISVGDHSAQLTVREPLSGTVSAMLDGRGTFVDGPTLVPLSRHFGSVAIGTTSSNAGFTLRNPGSGPLLVDSVGLGGANASEFTLVPGGDTCSGAMLPGGGSCTIDVVYAPATVGAHSASLTVVAGAFTTSSTLTGTGLPSDVVCSASPSTYDFGDVPLTNASTPVRFTVTNTGAGSLLVDSATIGGTNPADFVIGAGRDGCTGMTLAGGASCTVDVAFAPTALGARDASLVFRAGATSATVALAGNGR